MLIIALIGGNSSHNTLSKPKALPVKHQKHRIQVNCVIRDAFIASVNVTRLVCRTPFSSSLQPESCSP